MATGRPAFVSLERHKTLPASAAEQIARMILDRELPEGEKLPPERQLAEMLGVSRTVVREALRLLEARQLLETDVRGGAIVRGLGPGPVTDSINLLLSSTHDGASFEDVQAVRGVLEVGATVLAAQKRTEEDLRRIEDSLERMVNADTAAEHIQADYRFHLAIAQATHNRVFELLTQALNDVVVEEWREYWAAQSRLGPGQLRSPEAQESNAHHRQVYEAIRCGDPEATQEEMQRLLNQWATMYSHGVRSLSDSARNDG